MMGKSGGGWTTTLAAALDPRISFSAPIAGSIPPGQRHGPGADRGDGLGPELKSGMLVRGGQRVVHAGTGCTPGGIRKGDHTLDSKIIRQYIAGFCR